MLNVLFPLFGGIGLFLVGMMLLSQGLTTFAGDSLRRALMRFTGTPTKAFLSGTLVTVVIQSSTATTVTLIGFVSAGLIPFSQAVGVVMGASLGTTATGWMIAGLGLKINLGFYTLPFIGAGALMRLLLKGRWGGLGMALAGFGTLFVGLGELQHGMQGVAGHFDLAALPVGGIWAHVVVMLIGVVLTNLLQSSTAAVATTLTALHTATINIEQAAALVIGAAIGTTFTGALAAIGGSRSAMRTALAHILFNSATGLIAIVLLPFFLTLVEWLDRQFGFTSGAMSLAAFHTAFIAVGVVVFLPFAHTFARLIERMLPDQPSSMTNYLDASLLGVPSNALFATVRSLAAVSRKLAEVQLAMVEGTSREAEKKRLDDAAQAFQEIQTFFARIPPAEGSETFLQQRLALLHAMEHVQRLLQRLQTPMLYPVARQDENCQRALTYVAEMLRLMRDGLAGQGSDAWQERLQQDAEALTLLHREARAELLRRGGQGQQSADEALRLSETLRWLDRSSHHLWRIVHYLDLAAGEPEALKPAEPLQAPV